MSTPREVLSQYWDGTLPVDPSRIARAMGIPVQATALNVSGVIELEQGRPAISYNEADVPVRQRFTIAHEIGHYVLGHLNAGTPRFRDPATNFSSAADSNDERQANRFAADLLMPAETVQYAITKREYRGIAKLAALFGVSQVAMKYRLVQLGLIGG